MKYKYERYEIQNEPLPIDKLLKHKSHIAQQHVTGEYPNIRNEFVLLISPSFDTRHRT